jgi:hypothetical protein
MIKARRHRRRIVQRLLWILTIAEGEVATLRLSLLRARRRSARGMSIRRVLEINIQIRLSPPVAAAVPSPWIPADRIILPDRADIGRDQPYWLFASWVWQAAARSSGRHR